MIDTLGLLLLGILQGIAEFLPISSSGHLNIAAALWNDAVGQPLPDSLALNIALHLGTLGSIMVVYWRRIISLLASHRGMIPKLIVGTLPAGIAGLTLHSAMRHVPGLQAWFVSPVLAGCCLPLTGLILLAGRRAEPGTTDDAGITYRQALLVGLAQTLAIIPGISRSGSTIVAGLLVGLRRETAATFSFLLALPITAGAVLVEGRLLLVESTPLETWRPLLLGMIVSFFVGVVALTWLLRWLSAGRLHVFAAWCIPAGVAVLVWQALRG